MVGKVRILPELALEDPGLGCRLNSLDKFRVPPPNWTDEASLCSAKCVIRTSHKVLKFSSIS